MDRRRRPRQHSLELARPAAAGSSHDDGSTMSPELYLAVCGGRKEEAMALLLRHHASGIDQQLVSAGRNTVLHLAAVHGHDELIQELHATYGSSSNLLSSQNWTLDTPLHCAARAGRSNTVALLVQLARDSSGEQSGSMSSILGRRNEAGDTALHLAARLGHGAAVEAMVSAAPELASEANVNAAGASPFCLAVMGGSAAAVRAIAAVCSDVGCGSVATGSGPSSWKAGMLCAAQPSSRAQVR